MEMTTPDFKPGHSHALDHNSPDFKPAAVTQSPSLAPLQSPPDASVAFFTAANQAMQQQSQQQAQTLMNPAAANALHEALTVKLEGRQPRNYRTKICKHWEQGRCTFGHACKFAHGDEQLRGYQSQMFAQRALKQQHQMQIRQHLGGLQTQQQQHLRIQQSQRSQEQNQSHDVGNTRKKSPPLSVTPLTMPPTILISSGGPVEVPVTPLDMSSSTCPSLAPTQAPTQTHQVHLYPPQVSSPHSLSLLPSGIITPMSPTCLDPTSLGLPLIVGSVPTSPSHVQGTSTPPPPNCMLQQHLAMMQVHAQQTMHNPAMAQLAMLRLHALQTGRQLISPPISPGVALPPAIAQAMQAPALNQHRALQKSLPAISPNQLPTWLSPENFIIASAPPL